MSVGVWGGFLSPAEAGVVEADGCAPRARGLGAVGGDSLLLTSPTTSSSSPLLFSADEGPFLAAGTGGLERPPSRGEVLPTSATGEEPLELLVGNNRKHIPK